MGHEAWDKGFAVGTAKERAKKNGPSKAIVHDRKTGKSQSEVGFVVDVPRQSKGVVCKLD